MRILPPAFVTVFLLVAMTGCGGRTALDWAPSDAVAPGVPAEAGSCLADGVACGVSGPSCCTACVDGACGVPAAACHPGDPVATLYDFPTPLCNLEIFAITPRYVYFADEAMRLVRVPKRGGSPEVVTSSPVDSVFFNELGLFANGYALGCTRAPCGTLQRLGPHGELTPLASGVGWIDLLAPYAGGLLVAHNDGSVPTPVWRVPLDGSKARMLTTYDPDMVPLLDGDSFYDYPAMGAMLERVDLAAGTRSDVPGTLGISSPPAVDAGALTFADSGGNIVRVPRLGGTPTVVASGFQIDIFALIESEAEAIFDQVPTTPGPNTGKDGAIIAVDLGSGSVRKLAGSPDVSEVGHLEADSACVYWSEARWAEEGGPGCAALAIKRAAR